MISATTASIIAGVLAVIGAGLKLWWSYSSRKSQDADFRAGQDNVSNKQNQEAADAERRASEAGTNATRGPELDDALKSGKQQF